MTASLHASGVRIKFGGVAALIDASIAVEPGCIVGLIGRNGSGKSTLFNCMTGFCRPNGGTISIGRQDITGLPPQKVVQHGVMRTFQTPRVDLEATVHTTVLCGFYQTTQSTFLGALLGRPSAWREEVSLANRAHLVLERLGLAPLADIQLGRLSMGQLRLVEVARCVAGGAKFVLLDEPAAGLTKTEQQILADQLRDIAAHGIGVLLVEHNFALVRRLCERVTVLEQGRVLCTGTPDDIARDERVIRSYLGAATDLAAKSEAAA